MQDRIHCQICCVSNQIDSVALAKSWYIASTQVKYIQSGAEVAKQYDILQPTYKLTTSLFSSHPSDAFMVQMQMKLWLWYYLASIQQVSIVASEHKKICDFKKLSKCDECVQNCAFSQQTHPVEKSFSAVCHTMNLQAKYTVFINVQHRDGDREDSRGG